jgi:hypothetical protein
VIDLPLLRSEQSSSGRRSSHELFLLAHLAQLDAPLVRSRLPCARPIALASDRVNSKHHTPPVSRLKAVVVSRIRIETPPTRPRRASRSLRHRACPAYIESRAFTSARHREIWSHVPNRIFLQAVQHLVVAVWVVMKSNKLSRATEDANSNACRYELCPHPTWLSYSSSVY